MSARKQPAGARTNPLRVVGDPVPAAGPAVVAAVAAPLRTAYTPRELRQMMISEFADWLRIQTKTTDRNQQQNGAMTGSSIPWQQAPLAALDLEGTGAQDRDDEAILEIAVVPITGGQPDTASAYCTLVNPQREVPRRSWISPGLTTSALAGAPAITDIEPDLARRLDGAFIVGHNIGVDWRLLHRRCPSIRPAGLIDTLRLARLVYPGEKGNNLAKLLDRHQLTGTVTQLATDSQPHRALWDTIGAALLLHALATAQYPNGTISDLLSAASIDMSSDASPKAEKDVQGELFS